MTKHFPLSRRAGDFSETKLAAAAASTVVGMAASAVQTHLALKEGEEQQLPFSKCLSFYQVTQVACLVRLVVTRLDKGDVTCEPTVK